MSSCRVPVESHFHLPPLRRMSLLLCAAGWSQNEIHVPGHEWFTHKHCCAISAVVYQGAENFSRTQIHVSSDTGQFLKCALRTTPEPWSSCLAWQPVLSS